MVSFAPGQVTETELAAGVKPKAQGILFHPDLIKATSLGVEIKSYSFFSYKSNEALHLSDEEKGIFLDCLAKIKMELTRSIQEYIQNKLVDTAKEMIAGTDKAISQIAYDLGFLYSQHFNRVFKKNVGYTPVEYRKLQTA